MCFRKTLVPLALALAMFAIPFSPITGELCNSVMVVSAEENLGDDLGSGSVDEYDIGVADLFKNHRAMTPEHLDTASRTLSPVTNFFGYIIGGIMVLVCSGIFVITALDLIYIGIPPLRGLLYKGAQDEMQGGAPMGMGGYGGTGGYGRMGGSGVQRGLRFQLISDEAVQCSMLIGGGQQGAGGGMPGGYMNSPASPQNEMSNKSVVMVYFKKRVVFLVFFAVCAVMLTSSIFLGTGINIAQWLTNMVKMVNDFIPR